MEIEGESLTGDGVSSGIRRRERAPSFVFRPRPKHVQQQHPLWPRELDRPSRTDSFEGTEDASVLAPSVIIPALMSALQSRVRKLVVLPS